MKKEVGLELKLGRKLSANKIEEILKEYFENIKKIEAFEKMIEYYNRKKASNEIEVTDTTEMEISQISKTLNRLKFERMKIEAFLESNEVFDDDRLIIQWRYGDKKSVESICIEMFITNSSYYRKKREIFNKFRRFCDDSIY